MFKSELLQTLEMHPKGDIHVLRSHQTHKDTCLLVHGFLGNGYWWYWLIPFLISKYNVVIIDLPGMGKSKDRESYSLADMGEAINVVAEKYGKENPLHLIAHSFGALSSAHAILQNHRQFKTFHCIDMDLIHLQNNIHPGKRLFPRRYFSSEAELIKRFRLLPAETKCADSCIQLLAKKSITKFDTGWAWSFDPNVLNVKKNNVLENFKSICHTHSIPAQLILGKKTDVLNIEQASMHWTSIFNQTNIEIMPGYHHLMLDDPKKLSELIDMFIEDSHV